MLFDGVQSVLVCVCILMNQGDILVKGVVFFKVINIINNGLSVGFNMEKGGELVENLLVLYDYMLWCLLYVNLYNDEQVIIEVFVLFENIVDVWWQIGFNY